MENRIIHEYRIRSRAFRIWRKLGYFPWRKPGEQKVRKRSGSFYDGAFDNIPLLNEDAKRTFTHLLLRPGYMIRDYIKGDRERYLAPLTALIIFYSFFALLSAVLQPVRQRNEERAVVERLLDIDVAIDEAADGVVDRENMTEEQRNQVDRTTAFMKNASTFLYKGWLYLNLDRYPEEVDTQHESSIAALEMTLRNQGIPLFLGPFFLIWLSMALTLRRRKVRMSECAVATAYLLCQFSFFMLFALLLSFGKEAQIGLVLMLLLLALDYSQWLGVRLRKGFGMAVRTGIWYGVLYIAVILLIGAAAFIFAWLKR